MNTRTSLPKRSLSRLLSWPSVGLWLAYLVAFSISHEIARIWGGAYFFSLWYPAAGIRFAFLWRYGARWTFLIAAAELLAQSLLWTVIEHQVVSPRMAVDIILPSLTSGGVIAAIRYESRRNPSAASSQP